MKQSLFVAHKVTAALLLSLALTVLSYGAAQELEEIQMMGSSCLAENHDIAREQLAYVCAVDHTLEVGIMGAARLLDEWTLAAPIVEKSLETHDPPKRYLVAGVIQRATLYNGTVCDFAGEGATLAEQGKRLNYSCDGDLALFGPFNFEGSTQKLMVAQALVKPSADSFAVTGMKLEPVKSIIIGVENR